MIVILYSDNKLPFFIGKFFSIFERVYQIYSRDIKELFYWHVLIILKVLPRNTYTVIWLIYIPVNY